MGVMLLDHARVAVAELRGDDRQRGAVHRQMARMGMAQDMERDRRLDLRGDANFAQATRLMRLLPGRSVVVLKQ